MKAIIKKVSDCRYREEKEINSLKDLQDISQMFDNEPLIIDFFGKYISIKIYDDYIE